MNKKKSELQFVKFPNSEDFKKNIDYLKFLEAKSDGEIELYIDDIEELKQLNPLYAHIKISSILHEIVPILEFLLDKCGGDYNEYKNML